jgi:hypothetical protein
MEAFVCLGFHEIRNPVVLPIIWFIIDNLTMNSGSLHTGCLLAIKAWLRQYNFSSNKTTAVEVSLLPHHMTIWMFVIVTIMAI